MLNSLSFDVTFPATGRRISQNLDFQNGFGSITGPNEAGKSLAIEMVRYSLFGTAALRYKADSYQGLTSQLTFTVRGERYTVTRDRNPRLQRGEDVIAVGTRPVNEKIVEIFGYGLEVFDVANVANQGDLERLGQMRPTDRKRMVDNVIGLGVIEDLTRWCHEQATTVGREAAAIEGVLREPVAPTKPEGYAPSAELQQKVDELLVLKSELDQINGWLSAGMQEPVEPKPDGSSISTHYLAELARQEREILAEIAVLRRQLNNLPVASNHSDDDLAAMLVAHDQADAWEEWDRLPKRSHSVAELEAMVAAGMLIQQHEHQERVRHRLSKEDHHVCPACSHRFPADPEEVAKLEAQLVDLPPKPEPPALSIIAANIQLRIPDAPPEPLKVDRPLLPRKQIITFQSMNQRSAERPAIEAQIKQLEEEGPWGEYGSAYAARLRYEDAMMAHLKAVAAYARWQVERDAKVERAEKLMTEVCLLPGAQAALAEAVRYERDLLTYTEQSAAYVNSMCQVEALKEQQDGWRRAKASLVTLRLLVKQHLLPSLNKVASHLLVGMTGGQRRALVVDDEFEVQVDGQPLDTLSGSGKSVANLALRLGLGQVLTNNVFSVFIGDEIDAFMDANRAENTSNTLRLLKDSISQILLVTHKYPAADFYIDLGKHGYEQSH
jgi:exonuclease SbcC